MNGTQTPDLPSRRQLLMSCGAALAASPLAAVEGAAALTTPKVVKPGEGRQVWAMGILVTVKVVSEDTGGAYSVFEDYVPPGAGPVPHTHTHEDETMFVLEGHLTAWLGGQRFEVGPGDFVHMPRGVEHYFKNLTDRPARMLLTYTPGGFEKWFLEIGKPVAAGSLEPPAPQPEDIPKAVTAAQRFGVQFRKP